MGAGGGATRRRRGLVRLGLEIDGNGVDDRRGGIGGGTRRRQLQRNVVPALAGALHDIGAARQLSSGGVVFEPVARRAS